jgi:hypothetical protein
MNRLITLQAVEALLTHACANCLLPTEGVKPHVWLGCSLPSNKSSAEVEDWHWFQPMRVCGPAMSDVKDLGRSRDSFVSRIQAGLDALSYFGLGDRNYLDLSKTQYEQLTMLRDGYEAIKREGNRYGLDELGAYSRCRDKYDGTEVHPVAMIDASSAEVVDPDKAQFWSVYLHLKSGGIECVGNFATYPEAQNAASKLDSAFGFEQARISHCA